MTATGTSAMRPLLFPDDPQQRRGPIPSKLVHQAEEVLVDRRGVIYMSEGNSGIYILRHQTS